MNYKTVADTTQAVIEIQHRALDNITEGGMMDEKTTRDIEDAAWYTREHARQNIEKWGLQNLKTLIVVATEELGETAKEVLAHQFTSRTDYEANNLDRISQEAKDFAAVGLQIMALVEKLKGDFESEAE